MNQSFTRSFIAATGFALAGCNTTMPTVQSVTDGAGKAWDGVKAAVTPAPEAPKTRILHPDVQGALDNIGAKRNQSFNAEAKCPAGLLAGNGPSSTATNRYAAGSAGKQAENFLGGLVNQGLGKLGTAGKVIKPTTDAVQATASAQSDQLQVVCGRIGQVNKQWIAADALADNQKGGIYQNGYNQLSTAMTLAANAKLTDGAVTRNGADAMIERGTNASQNIFWGKIVNGIYTPKGPNGAVGDLLDKVGPK